VIKTYRAGPLGRMIWVGLILLGAANLPIHSVGLFEKPSGEHISRGMHIGASLFVMVLSAGMVLFGVSGLRTRLEVDTTGMRRERPWTAPGLDIRWEQVESWGFSTGIKTGEMNDGWGGPSVTTETRSERLEIALNAPPSRMFLGPRSPFFRAILEALRAHTPTKEQSLPAERA
jgi:hypothetical protein